MSENVRTISVSKGKGYIPHNTRVFTPSNTDPNRTELNRTYVYEDLTDAYERLFGDAIRTYDENQKRADRRIGSSAAYLTRMKGGDGEGSKNGEQPFYEIIVQIGDMHDTGCGTPDGDLATQILDEYAKSFQERNPRLHVIGMYLHLDEATPHLHVDFVPVADGYKTGMSVRNGLDRALKQQGVSPGKNNRKSNATIVWQDQERDALAEIMQRHGIERADPTGSDRKGLPIDQYRAMAESLQNQIEQHPLPKAKKALGGGVKLSEKEWSDVASLSQLSQQLAQSADSAIDTANRKIKEAAYLRNAADRALERAAVVEHQLPGMESDLAYTQYQLSRRNSEIEKLQSIISEVQISAQYLYTAVEAIKDTVNPQDMLMTALMSVLKDELTALLSELHIDPDTIPQYGALAPLAGSIAAELMDGGASLRFDELSETGTASIIADLPGGSDSLVLASDLPDFAAVRQLIGRMKISRNVRTRNEYLADARTIVTPLLQAMYLGPDAPREQIRDMLEQRGVIPVIDKSKDYDLWHILLPKSFAPGLDKYNVVGEDVSIDHLADFWLPKHLTEVRMLDQTAQARARQREQEQQKKKTIHEPSHRRSDNWSR